MQPRNALDGWTVLERAWGKLGAVLLLLLTAVPIAAVACGVSRTLDVGPFSVAQPDGPLPKEWRPLYFPHVAHTRYTLVRQGGHGVVVRAEADDSASGLVRKIRVDPEAYPLLCWSWRIKNLIPGSDVHRKDGDDYSARVHVTFNYPPSRLGLVQRLKYDAVRLLYGEAPPLRAITYIWAAHAPKGTVVPSPYTRDARMFVVESGASRLNRWVREERDVAADYRRAFHSAPPEISGVAIMTDTDNTNETATAWYGDIVFGRLQGP